MAAKTVLPSGERIPDRLLDRHGRWAPGSSSRVGYLDESAEDLLLVPSSLQL